MKTYYVRLANGEQYEVDLDDEHAQPLIEIAQWGRPVGRNGGKSKTWDSMIRGAEGAEPG